MATELSEWVPEISIPLVPNLLVKKIALEICRDFCEFTQLWNNNALTAIDIVSGTADYVLSSSDGEIVKIDDVFFDDSPLNPTVIDHPNLPRTWREDTAKTPHKYIYDMGSSIKLIYIPSEDKTGALKVYVTLKPLSTATSVEDFLWTIYKDVISNGIKWKLYGLAGAPWWNVQESELYRIKYQFARAEAADKRRSGRTNLETILPGGFFA